MFRHWVLGFGSGDLIVRPVGPATPWSCRTSCDVGRAVKQIQELVKEQVVVSDPRDAHLDMPGPPAYCAAHADSDLVRS